jgi:hypothetical protein
MNDRKRGFYNKFHVHRVDGSPKHEGCEYFVLDLDHDKHAYAALRAYADSCRAEYPLLAADLDTRCADMGRHDIPMPVIKR